jgi:hypothetical protein
MIASEQDNEREGDADAVGLDARTDQHKATGAKETHGLANDTRWAAAFVAAIRANDIAAMARLGMNVAVLGDGSTPLHFAAQQGQVAQLKWLVELGADVHAKDKNGSTPLHVAARHGQVASLEWLVEQGADIHAKREDGMTAFHVAARQGHMASLEWLAGQGADIHAKTPFTLAGVHGSENGSTALHFAAQSGQTLAITWLIEQGVSTSIAERRPAETVSLPSTVAVVGANEGYSGLYKKQQRTDGRVSYRMADSNQAIWYDTDDYGGKWCIGELGSDGTTGRFAVAIDSATSPLNIEATWHELAWEPCSRIRVTKSKKKHTKVIEVKGVPDNLGVDGKYRPQAQIIDGRPTYRDGPSGANMIWYSASTGSWRVGRAIFAGTSRHLVDAKDTAATPNTVKTPWCVSTAYALPNPCAKIILPSVKVAEQEVPRQMQLKMPKAMSSEQSRCLGCGHQYTSQAEVVFHEECLHHHCMHCRDELDSPSCAVCAEVAIGDYLGNEEREESKGKMETVNPNPPSKKGIPSIASKAITNVLRHWTPALKDNATVFFTLDGLAAAFDETEKRGV